VDELKRRLALARKAFATMREALGLPKTAIVRDAAIQRFEYSFEAVWKAAQRFLREREGVEAASPKAVVRASFSAGLLDEPSSRRALSMVDDRNLTVHTYNEPLAEAIYSRLADHASVLESWLAALERRAQT
jgi:nucleotidyltransferase substrate binding protein (TIGR01987 family)